MRNQLEKACSGTLLAPPLKIGDDHVRVQTEILDEVARDRFRAKFKPGASLLVKVQYLDEFPDAR